MNCPNCNNVIDSGNVCSACGIDVILFKKTIKISDLLYNKGLALAQANDLWNASDALYKSIQFNKNNYYARNLLGLVYLETGRIGDALKHWIISASLMQKDNPAIRYIEAFQQDGKKIDLFNDAIKMYNQALVNIQQKSDDLAVIQLKKAIENNPKFVDALNLLTFCYLIQNEKGLSADLVNKVLTIDVNNPIALNYYKEIHQTKRKPKPAVNITENKKSLYAGTGGNKLTKEEQKKGFGNNFYFAEIVSFLLGGICTAALAYTLVFPGLVSERDDLIASQHTAISELETRINTELEEKNNEVMALNEENSGLKEQIAVLSSQIDIQDKINRINNAREIFQSGEVEEAAAMIYALDPTGLADEDLEEYESLRNDAYSAAGNILYNRGVRQFNANDYDNAKRSFESCLLYAPESARYIADATYYLGLIAEEEEDFDRARTFYNTVIEQHPNTNRANNAKTRLNNLSE